MINQSMTTLFKLIKMKFEEKCPISSRIRCEIQTNNRPQVRSGGRLRCCDLHGRAKCTYIYRSFNYKAEVYQVLTREHPFYQGRLLFCYMSGKGTYYTVVSTEKYPLVCITDDDVKEALRKANFDLKEFILLYPSSHHLVIIKSYNTFL